MPTLPLILHLSDLHLGTKDTTFGDYKSEFVPSGERETRQRMLRRSLKALGTWLRDEHETVDAVVISGDMTYANDEVGYQQLEDVLELLGDRLPPKNRIVIVPGNHDVTNRVSPSCEEKYKYFLKYVATRGFVTPMLDGVDFPSRAGLAVRFDNRYLLDVANNWFILPVNSSNYCQVVEPTTPIEEPDWQRFEKSLSRRGKAKVQKVLSRLRLNDSARISVPQFEAMEELLREVEGKIRAAGKDPKSFLRVAVLHHHLLPVSTAEEVKKFESLSNLGLLREFLASHSFGIVLHGHKHVGKVYWDYIPSEETAKELASHRILVVSGGTLGMHYNPADQVCRLINLQTSKSVHEVVLRTVKGLAPAERLERMESERVALWDPSPNDPPPPASPLVRITGKTSDETYARILARLCDENKEECNVICQVEDPASATTIPKQYPEVPGVDVANRQSWFDQLVSWWQLSNPTLSKTFHFTHGERISGTDQITRVSRLLEKRAGSSRAVVALFDPNRDDVTDHKKKFPSFCLAQFIIRDGLGARPRLDCVAYFRKQEMKYWWPVNVAELARLQNEVFQGIQKKDKNEKLILGSITTFAAMTRVGKRAPQVSVPAVDRHLDQDPGLLWSMAYAIFWQEMPKRRSYLNEWEKILNELVPEDVFDADGGPVPLKGLMVLSEELKRFAKHHPEVVCRDLLMALDDLVQENLDYVECLYENEDKARTKHAEWRQKATDLTSQIRSEIRRLFN